MNSGHCQRFLERMAPILVQVELTEACNLRCAFCYNSQQPRYGRETIRILETLRDQGVAQVTLTGGEPLMHPDFFSILKVATSLFPQVIVLSNGSLMTPQVIDRLHQYPILCANISIHGCADSHDYLTGVKGSFAASIRAVQDFIRRETIPIASNFVLTAFNAGDLRDTLHYLRALGLRNVTVTRFTEVGCGREAPELRLTQKHLVHAFWTIHEEMQLHEFPRVVVADATPFCILPQELRYLANCCSYGHDRFYVDVDGNLITCGLARIPLGGNVLHASLDEIRRTSSVFQKYLATEHVPLTCQQCELFAECRGGCRAAAYGVSGELASEDPIMSL